MVASLATASAILKEIYEPRIRKQLDDDNVALRRVEKSSDGVENTVGGRYVTFAIKTRRNTGIGARNELEQLPTPGQQGNAAARVGLKYLYGGIRLTGQAMKLADSNYQAFASVLDQEINGLRDDLAKDSNRQVYGDGSGVMCTLDAGTSVNTLTANDVMYLQEGMQVDIVDGTTLGAATPTVKASNRQVTAINVSANTFVIDGAAVSPAAGDVVVRTGNVNREWTGLKAIVKATGTLYNIDPSVEGVWKATEDTNGGTDRALSEGLMITMADAIRAKGSYPTVILTNLGVRRAYFNLLSQQRSYTNTKTFDGGFTGLGFTTDRGEIPVVTDTDCPKGTAYFINEKEITLYRESDWSWMDEDGSKWARVTGYDAYDAVMYQYSEIGTHRRNAHGVITNIIEG